MSATRAAQTLGCGHSLIRPFQPEPPREADGRRRLMRPSLLTRIRWRLLDLREASSLTPLRWRLQDLRDAHGARAMVGLLLLAVLILGGFLAARTVARSSAAPTRPVVRVVTRVRQRVRQRIHGHVVTRWRVRQISALAGTVTQTLHSSPRIHDVYRVVYRKRLVRANGATRTILQPLTNTLTRTQLVTVTRQVTDSQPITVTQPVTVVATKTVVSTETIPIPVTVTITVP